MHFGGLTNAFVISCATVPSSLPKMFLWWTCGAKTELRAKRGQSFWRWTVSYATTKGRLHVSLTVYASVLNVAIVGVSGRARIVFAWHRRNIYKGPLPSEEHEPHPLAEDEELRSYRSNAQRRTWWSLSSCWPWPSLYSVAERTPWTISCVSTTMTSVSVSCFYLFILFYSSLLFLPN